MEYWIKEGSWGLLPVELSCPVCSAEMMDDDWMPYISGNLLDLWHKFKIKRKETIKKLEINRPCPDCNHLQPLMGTASSIEEFAAIGDSLMSILDSSSFESWRNVFDLENVLDLIQEMNEAESGSDFEFSDFLESAQELFQEFIELIEKLKIFGFLKSEEQELIRLLMRFGRMFLHFISKGITKVEQPDYTIDVDDDDDELAVVEFIDMQLNFQLAFPFGHCDECNLDFCLPCQSPTWFHSHPASNILRPDGSKQCPRCFISIEKDSDGCNEMRCNYCGMKFCWECGRKWSKNCGIYKCKQQEEYIEDTGDGQISMDSEIPRSEAHFIQRFNTRDPEIGVPNVHILHQR